MQHRQELTWSKDVVEAKGHAAAGAGGSRHGSVAAVAAQAGCLSAHQPAGQVRPHPAGDQKACSAQFRLVSTTWASFGAACAELGLIKSR